MTAKSKFLDTFEQLARQREYSKRQHEAFEKLRLEFSLKLPQFNIYFAYNEAMFNVRETEDAISLATSTLELELKG